MHNHRYHLSRLFGCLVLATTLASGAEDDISAVIKKSQELNDTDRAAAAKFLKDAIADYTSRTKTKPDEASGWYGLACLTFEFGQDDQAAQAALDRALSLAPNEPRYYVQ